MILNESTVSPFSGLQRLIYKTGIQIGTNLNLKTSPWLCGRLHLWFDLQSLFGGFDLCQSEALLRNQYQATASSVGFHSS